MRTANPLLLSVGIHLALAALMLGAFSAVHKTAPIAAEKTALKIVMQPPASEYTLRPIARPQADPLPKVQPVPIPSVPQPIVQVKQPAAVPSKSSAVAPQQIAPALSTPAATSKISDSASVTAPKASPLPIAKESYEEENLGRIRSILMERLVYPKNAVRLKQQGEAIVTFTLETTREVSHITITKSSGFELLDDAAKNLILTSAGEFPKPAKAVRISLPVAYKLR